MVFPNHLRQYDHLKLTIRNWAATHNNVAAILIVGSRSDPELDPDMFSDLDLILFVDDPSEFVSSSSWIEQINPTWLSVLSQTGRGHPEWTILFAEGIKADLIFVESGKYRNLAELIENSGYQFVIAKGYSILYAKESTSESSPLFSGKRQKSVYQGSSEIVSNTVDKALILGYQVARYGARGDLWRAFQTYSDFKSVLLRLFELQAREHGKHDDEIGYDGHDIMEWIDPEIGLKIPELFPGFEQNLLLSSLRTALDLIRFTVGALDKKSADTGLASGQKSAMILIEEICTDQIADVQDSLTN